MTVRRAVSLALMLAAYAAAPAQAQTGPLRLTVEEAIARTDAASGRLAELEARRLAAAAVEDARGAAGLPIVSLLAGYQRTNHVDEFAIALPGGATRVLYPDVPDNYRARLDLQWPIYTAGRTAALERAAAAERRAAAADIEAARADLRLEATRAFWALVTALETEGVLARALETTAAHVRVLRERLDQGLIPPNEVLTADAQQSRQRLLAIEARNLRGAAESELRRLLRLEPDVAIEPVPPPGIPSDGSTPHAGALADAALGARAERQALTHRLDAARGREAAAEAAARPQLTVGAGYDYARPNPRIFPRTDEWRTSWDIGVNVGWVLWDGGRREAEAAEAAAGTRAIAARAAEFDRQLTADLAQRRLDVDTARAAIEAAEDGVRAAVEARRVVGERYAVGVATNTDVLDADTAVLQAQLDRTRAHAGLRLALARFDRAAGR